MVRIEREDFEESFTTCLRFVNGNQAQEIQVYVWEADAIEAKLQALPLATVMALYNKKGSKIVKEW